jgi:hypothetical protein
MPMGEMPTDADGGGPSASPQRLPGMFVRNLREPLRLKDVNLGGVSAEAAQGGGTLKVWTRLALTSDDPLFHRIVENMVGALSHLVRQAGGDINFGRTDSVLMVIRPDQTAELWADGAAVVLNIRAKRNMQAGTAVFERDIADVIGLDFPGVDIGPNDKVFYLFREDWRFALFFDFNPDNSLSRDEMARTLGTLYRRLKYHHLYDMLANETVFGRLIDAGWFPFVEIIGSEFKTLALACEAGFSLTEAEAQLMRNFDDARLDRMFERWVAKPSFKSKEPLLKAAISAYKANEPVAVLKIVLTEIEGILAEAHMAQEGTRPKLKQLLQFARASAERKSGAPDTLLFPVAFAKYLERYTYANFDPTAGTGHAGSRHAVGHGAAVAESYTKARALQALLTLDQFVFYV